MQFLTKDSGGEKHVKEENTVSGFKKTHKVEKEEL